MREVWVPVLLLTDPDSGARRQVAGVPDDIRWEGSIPVDMSTGLSLVSRWRLRVSDADADRIEGMGLHLEPSVRDRAMYAIQDGERRGNDFTKESIREGLAAALASKPRLDAQERQDVRDALVEAIAQGLRLADGAEIGVELAL